MIFLPAPVFVEEKKIPSAKRLTNIAYISPASAILFTLESAFENVGEDPTCNIIITYSSSNVPPQKAAWFSQEPIFGPKNPSAAPRFCGFKSNLCHGNIKIEIRQAFLRKPLADRPANANKRRYFAPHRLRLRYRTCVCLLRSSFRAGHQVRDRGL
jgi:hypothetical protein